MEVFRLTRKKYSRDLSGKGASIKGGRWNSIGTELIYCAENRSLAMAEIAVHFSIATLPDDYVMMCILCDKSIKIKEVSVNSLPRNWNSFPPIFKTQIIGDEFVVENKYAICKIPSVVTQGDYNYLINPNHKEFVKIKIVKREAFKFDKRLFK